MNDPTLYQRSVSPSGRVTYRPLEAKVQIDRETVTAFMLVLAGAIAVQIEESTPDHSRIRRGIISSKRQCASSTTGNPSPATFTVSPMAVSTPR